MDVVLVEVQVVATVVVQLQEVIQNQKAHIVVAVLQERVILHQELLPLLAAQEVATAEVVQREQQRHVPARQHGKNRPQQTAQKQRILHQHEIVLLQKVVKPHRSNGNKCGN